MDLSTLDFFRECNKASVMLEAAFFRYFAQKFALCSNKFLHFSLFAFYYVLRQIREIN